MYVVALVDRIWIVATLCSMVNATIRNRNIYIFRNTF